MTYDQQKIEFYGNRSKYTKIKPHEDGWIVHGRTVVATLAEAVRVRDGV